MVLPYKGKKPRLGKGVFIAPGAVVAGDVEIGDNSSIWFGTVVRGDEHFVRIGRNTNVQDGCILHVTGGKYPLIMGNNITVGHGAVVHACTVEDEVLIGIGAIVLDGAVIRKHSVVAAGSLVPPGMEVPSGVIVAGVPAKVLRELRDGELETLILDKYKHYLELKEDYMPFNEAE